MLESLRARLSHDEMKLYVKYRVARLAFEYMTGVEKIDHLEDRYRRFRLVETYLKGRRFQSPQHIVEKTLSSGPSGSWKKISSI